jgi:hypothetical protein
LRINRNTFASRNKIIGRDLSVRDIRETGNHPQRRRFTATDRPTSTTNSVLMQLRFDHVIRRKIRNRCELHPL